MFRKHLSKFLISICFFIAGFLLHDIIMRISPQFGLLTEAHGYLTRHYVNDLPAMIELQRGMIEGMVARVGDPYTAYYPPTQHELQTDALQGEYGGIGVRIVIDDAENAVLFPFAQGPAARGGIMEGDVLISIDGRTIDSTLTMDDISALLRGEEGTMVRVGVLQSPELVDALEVIVERENFPTPSVQGFLHPTNSTIGVLDVNLISQQTLEEIDLALRTLLNEGASAFLLDLRGNTGGLLDESISVADFFLASGVILIERMGEAQEVVHEASDGEIGETIQMVVLIDGGTASAAEIIAAALQQNARATVIGTPSFGKGSVQSIYELQDGSSIHITTAQWLTPSEGTIDQLGVAPDILVDPGGESVDLIADAAINLLLAE